MATIKISDLCNADYALSFDFESYMTELTNSELNNISGGGTKKRSAKKRKCEGVEKKGGRGCDFAGFSIGFPSGITLEWECQ
jgi:bacteriocin-like protein